MKVAEFKALAPDIPLPDELADESMIEQYLADIFLHGARVALEQNPDAPLFTFSIDAKGMVRGDLSFPVNIAVTLP